jgi:hypothetical protein
MRHVQLDRIEADAHRPLGRLDERCLHPREIVLRHGAWLRPGCAEGDRRRRNGLPGVLARLQAEPTLPGPLRGRLAPGMADLDAELGRADAPAMLDDALERRLAGVRIEAEAAMRDAAGPLDGGRLDDDEGGARIRQHA